MRVKSQGQLRVRSPTERREIGSDGRRPKIQRRINAPGEVKECGLKDVRKNESPSVERTDDGRGQKVIHCDGARAVMLRIEIARINPRKRGPEKKRLESESEIKPPYRSSDASKAASTLRAHHLRRFREGERTLFRGQISLDAVVALTCSPLIRVETEPIISYHSRSLRKLPPCRFNWPT